jgi:hypothetical protein
MFVAPTLLIGSTQKSTGTRRENIPMLKKIVLLATLAAASVLSLNIAARSASAPASSTTVTMKFPPCSPWSGCAVNN